MLTKREVLNSLHLPLLHGGPMPPGKYRKATGLFQARLLDPEVQDDAKPVLQLWALFVFMWDVLTSCRDL